MHEVDVGDDDGANRLRGRSVGFAWVDPTLSRDSRGLSFDRHGQHHRLLGLFFEDLQLPHSGVGHHLIHFDRSGAESRLSQRGPRHIGLVVLDEGTREREEHLLQPRSDRLAGVERRQFARGIRRQIGVDEDKLIRKLELWMWVVILTDDERIGAGLPHGGPSTGGHQFEAKRLPQLADVALGLLLWLKHRHRTAAPTAGLRGARHALHQHRQRIFEHRHGLPRTHGGHEVVHLLRPK